jgi:hypothetical protein
MFLIGSEHEPVVVRSNVTRICQSQNARHKSFYSKASLLYRIHEKSMYIFPETIRLFVCFLPVFSSFRIFQLFNFCQPRFKNTQLLHALISN